MAKKGRCPRHGDIGKEGEGTGCMSRARLMDTHVAHFFKLNIPYEVQREREVLEAAI